MSRNHGFGSHYGNSPNYGSDSTLENSTYLWDKHGGGKGRFSNNDIYGDDFDDGYDDGDDE